MLKVIGMNELQGQLEAVVEEVAAQQTVYVLQRGDQPQAAFVPYEQLRRFQAFQESEVGRRFDRLLDRMARRNTRFSEQEVADDVAAALAELDE